MAYTIRHTKADGSTAVTRVDGPSSVTVERDTDGGAAAVIVKDRTKRQVGYNFNRKLGGPNLSKQNREAQLRKMLQEMRSEYQHTKGFSKGRTMKHLASIPPEFFYKYRAEHGLDATHDLKHMLKKAREWGVRVS